MQSNDAYLDLMLADEVYNAIHCFSIQQIRHYADPLE
jgi:hypothetical protein